MVETDYLGFVRLPTQSYWYPEALLDQMLHNKGWYGESPDYDTLHKQAIVSRMAFIDTIRMHANTIQGEFRLLLSVILHELRQNHRHQQEVILVAWILKQHWDVTLVVQALPVVHIPTLRAAIALQYTRRVMQKQNISSTIPVSKLARGSGLRKVVREAINCLHIKNGDIILLRSGTRLARETSTNALAEALSRQGYDKSIVAIVDEFDDLSVINEAQMNQLGWQRIPVTQEVENV